MLGVSSMNIRKSVAVLMAAIASLLPGSSVGGPEEWPNLPSKNFLAGRAASQDDVNEGRAVFVLAQDGVVVGRPIDIAIPQYALMDGGPSRPPIWVVVVQAEEVSEGKARWRPRCAWERVRSETF